MMKKVYATPVTRIQMVCPASIIAESITVDNSKDAGLEDLLGKDRDNDNGGSEWTDGLW